MFSAFGFKRPTDGNQFEGMPCPVMWKQQFVFPCLTTLPLREAVLFCRDSVPASARGSVGSASARGIFVGRGRWFWRPQTHTYLERKRCQVGIIP